MKLVFRDFTISIESSTIAIKISRKEETLSDFDNGHLYGLEKFWAFLHYSGKKNYEMDDRLAELLKKYKTLNEFRKNSSLLAGFF
ncbi:unnamed protein product [Protopolystoma xenopodis]|uniref:Uncharacterized protein n=1 Tax=Protopolystoma xenopodis TaxID=117903 RepID=A0A3S5AJF1_9PLAT|nr:unnamed protein product [Protopolystoma xenopodis]